MTTILLRPLLWPRSLGGEFLSILFGVFKFWTVVQLLAPMMFLRVWASPASQSINDRGVQSSSATASPSPQTSSSNLSTSSSFTQILSTARPSASPSAGSNSGPSQLTDSQLTIMLSVIGGIIVVITVLLFLMKWRKKKNQRHHGSSAKDEDRQPLSASFQPGELPTLPYWPQPKSPPPQGLA